MARMSFPGQIVIRPVTLLAMLLLAIALLYFPAQAVQAKETYLGDMVLLSGHSYGSDTVYLFLTGPNLPLNGVALDNVNRPTDQGGFTVVDVNSDGFWSYKWYTGQTGGKIDAGAYTVWVVDRPSGRSNLGTSDYSTITVNLQQPGISAGNPSATGGLTVNSTPPGANLFLDGKYEGKTPTTIPELDPGTYVASVSSPGFLNQSAQVEVQAGTLTSISITLLSSNGTLWVTTVPVGGTIRIDGKDAGITPVLLTNLTPGNHTVMASLQGLSPVQETVMVIGGVTIPVSITFAKENLTSERQVSTTNPILFPGGLTATILACIIAVFLAGFRRW